MRMMVAPGILWATTITVAVVNQSPDRQLLFPMLDKVVGPDPFAQGFWTIVILAVLATLLTLVNALSWWARKDEPGEAL